MANDSKSKDTTLAKKDQAAPATQEQAALTKQESDEIQNDVLKSVVGGEDAWPWIDGWAKASIFGKVST